MSARQSTAALLEEAARYMAQEAQLLKGACSIGDDDWACQGCDPDTCIGRKEHAAAADLAARLQRRAHEEAAPDPLGDALNSGDGSYRP